ncbi:LysR substrate-binding domain-containing protein [Phyllobacterium myrsinacearum]|uniref:DNA-binding transcriptional LysR family regulator n=1 Tax=Phyllobacterium myrsinacearum TaxID=28101 RepID=A0A839EUN2_9HYPH|nr:LysR substrate-binding domain-containing protein [Phyllobacterium myrsinacearum]MBA8881036.1 DNA-binding transcriptional LysR family regulator [Phyllobacterium myrsinacearum]
MCSNVTTRIQQLEAEIGVPLFLHNKKRMTLTTQDESYLDYVDRILKTFKERFLVQEVNSCHAMYACTAAGSCFSIMPRSVVELMRGATAVEEKPLMTVDTYLACRPGFATPAFEAFRDTLVQFSNIRDGSDATN